MHFSETTWYYTTNRHTPSHLVVLTNKHICTSYITCSSAFPLSLLRPRSYYYASMYVPECSSDCDEVPGRDTPIKVSCHVRKCLVVPGVPRVYYEYSDNSLTQGKTVSRILMACCLRFVQEEWGFREALCGATSIFWLVELQAVWMARIQSSPLHI